MGYVNTETVVDDDDDQRGVVADPLTVNARVLDEELNWFFRLLDTRIKLHFGHDCDYDDIFDIAPPRLTGIDAPFSNFLNHYEMSFAERVVFVLALIPHVKPQILDVFFSKNASNSRSFTEFGGRSDQPQWGFIPTGETALFILAGEKLERRLAFSSLFDADHFFVSHDILRLDGGGEKEPLLGGTLMLSREVIDLVTTGNIRRPLFGSDFPAKRIETALDWADLVLDPYTMDRVMEIKAWIRHGHRLLNDFNLRRKIKPGYRSLFYGPSGTGKTLTASLLGKVTGQDVYRIDLSLVVSKYIGETEKNIEKVFSKAEHRNWILFFDEADALFGKRTSINDAHDRFANQEVSYLLQRVEDYAGVAILASNLKSNIDEAFSRRFQSVIHFPMPGKNERLRLWKNAFTGQLRLADNIDLGRYAEEYELSGGAIINVVRYAALMMLNDNEQVISAGDLKEGIRRELQKEGRSS